ncbi:MAG: bifunctional nuclease family protein [Bacteroidales bacterium]|nr:bifunctional nuclease family protein [Bacteroidales bacterium]
MKKIPVKIHSIAEGRTGSAYVLTLVTQDNNKAFLVAVAEQNADAFKRVYLDQPSTCPQTHDLLCDILQRLDVEVQEVYIRDVRNGIFYTTMYCIQNEQELEFEASAVDALLLAIKTNSPVFADEKVIQKIGFSTKELEKILYSEEDDFSFDDDNGEDLEGDLDTPQLLPIEKLLKYESIAMLEELLEQAVAEEKFELASKLRDVINAKKNKSCH